MTPSVPASGEPLLDIRNVSKRFPGVRALTDVSLSLRAGEVLALVGENGAGKSTLMKILGGVQPPDEGTVLLAGRPLPFGDVKAAQRAGVALIHQELLLADNLSIAGNVFLGNEPATRWGTLDRGRMNREAAAILHRLGVPHPPTTLVSTLTTGQRQLVEIAKALAFKARVLILDEPTASLTLSEARRLYGLVREFKAAGLGIIYISHRMAEVRELCDRAVILRDGRVVGEADVPTTPTAQIVNRMVGREMKAWYPTRSNPPRTEEVLHVKDWIVPGSPAGVSFAVRAGEIVGLAGLVGAGRTELLRTLFGIDQAQGGTAALHGRPFRPRRPKDAIRQGVYLIPEDRKHDGLVLPMTVAQNVSLPDVANYKPTGWLNRRRERKVAAEAVSSLGIRTPTVRQPVVTLSGGNQQKVVLGKWLAMRPSLLLLDEPTRGVDVGAKAEIYRLIAALADRGIAILMASSEMEEVLGLSDRVLVLHERRLTADVPRAQASEGTLIAAMTGQKPA